MLVLVTVIAVKLLVSLPLRSSARTRRRSVNALLLGCLTSLPPAGAHAAESAAEPGALPCPTAADPAGRASGVLDVAALFGEFQCRLAGGQYDAALIALERACSASDDPACLFNRGLVHHAQLQLADATEVEHCVESRRNYSGYVDVSPYEAPAERARQALLELAQICGPVQVTPAPEVPPDPEVIPAWHGDVPLLAAPSTRPPENLAPPAAPHEPDAVRRRTTTWLLLGAGAASAVAAVVTGIHTKRAYDDLTRLEVPPEALADSGISPDKELPVYDTPETRSLDARLTRYEVLTWGFGATAAVLLGIGLGRTFLDSGPGPALSISAGPGFGGLRFGGEL